MRQYPQPLHPLLRLTRGAFLPLLVLAFVSFSPASLAQEARVSDDDWRPDAWTPSREEIESYADVEVEPFARVRYEEGGVYVQRRDGYDEAVGFNAPVYVGDRIRTGSDQRVELQLPDGTLLRLDRGSELEIYQLAESRVDRAPVLLGLSYGTLQADIPNPDGGDGFRVDTPSASVYPLEATSLRIDVGRGDEVIVSLERGGAEVAGADGTRFIAGGERIRVLPGRAPSRPYRYNVLTGDSFDRWVGQRDDVYRLRAAPGPEYDDLPHEVRPYYPELSRHGRWVWSDEWGTWVWAPEVADDWRPYVRGRWSPGPYGPVWVGVEPWSWSVYRYGRWGWYAGVGWTWIPGRVFAPAHVTWYYGPSYVGWCPLGWWNRPVRVGFSIVWGDPWFDYHPWVFVPYGHFWHNHVPAVHVPRGSIVPGDLRRGVIARRSIVPPGRSAVVAGRGAATRSRGNVVGRGQGLSPAVYEEAKQLARRRGSVVRPVSELAGEKTGQAGAARTRSFRDQEAAELGARRSRGAAVGRGDAAPAGRSRGAVTRGSSGRPDLPARGSGASRSRGSAGPSRGATAPATRSRGSDAPASRSRGNVSRGSSSRDIEPGSDRSVIRFRRPDQGSPARRGEDAGAVRRSAPAAGAPPRQREAGPDRATPPASSRTRSFPRSGATAAPRGDDRNDRRPAARGRSERGDDHLRQFFGALSERGSSNTRGRSAGARTRTDSRGDEARPTRPPTRRPTTVAPRPGSTSRRPTNATPRSGPTRRAPEASRSRGSSSRRPSAAPGSRPAPRKPSVSPRSRSGSGRSGATVGRSSGSGSSRGSSAGRTRGGSGSSGARSRGSSGSSGRSRSSGGKSRGG
jgi:hypothetical protein